MCEVDCVCVDDCEMVCVMWCEVIDCECCCVGCVFDG